MEPCLNRPLLGAARLSIVQIITIAILILHAGCGGGGGGGYSDSTPPAKDADLLQTVTATFSKSIGSKADLNNCSAISLSSITAKPGDIITVNNVPGDFEQPVFRAISKIDTLEIAGVIPLFATNTNGEYVFATPLYTLNPETGGTVTLELSDVEARQHCAGIEFTINPLAKTVADNDTRAYLDEFQLGLEEWIDEAIYITGKDSENLLNKNFNELKPETQMLWLAKQYVSSDDPGFLKSLLNQLEPDNANLLANILSAAGTKQRITAAFDALAFAPRATVQSIKSGALNSPLKTPFKTQAMPYSKASSNPLSIPASPTIQSRSLVPHIDCDTATLDFKYEINTVGELSQHMKEAKEGIPFDVSAGGQLLSVMTWYGAIMDKGIDILGASADLSDEARALLGSTKEKLNSAGGVMDVMGDTVFVIEKVQGALQAVRPGEITLFSLEGAETKWEEDRDESDLMTWQAARIGAKGEDYNLYHVLLETTQRAGSWVAKLIGSDKGKQVYDIATTLLSTQIESLFKDLSQDQCFRIKAPEYGPIVFTDETAKWTKTTVREGNDNVVVIDEKNYKGIHIGQALLEVKPRIEQFPSKSGINLPSFLTVKVQEVQVAANPVYRSVNNTPQTFDDITAFVSAYSDDAAKHIDATANKGTINALTPQGKTLTVNYTTPANLAELPSHIDYQWVGKTLPGGDDNLRQAKVTFDKRGKIALSPDSACLTPGEQLPITATIEGFPSADAIAWTGEYISEAPGGNNLKQIFTASTLGKYTITAFSIDDDTVFDETSVTVAASCIAMAWNPHVEYLINGTGLYSDGSRGCPPDSEPDYIEHEVINDAFPEPPAQAASWAGKSETYSWSNPHSSTRYNGDTEGNCYSAHFNGRNNSSVTYSGDGDGTLSFSFEADMAGDIKKIDTTTDKVDTLFVAIIAGFYYIPIKTDTQVHIEGSIACNNVTDDKILAGRMSPAGEGIGVMIIPYDESGQPMTGWMPGRVSNTDMPFVVNGIACQNNEMNFFDKTITINEFNGKRPSKIVLMVAGGTMASPYPMRPELHPVGSYEITGSVDFEIKVKTQ